MYTSAYVSVHVFLYDFTSYYCMLYADLCTYELFCFYLQYVYYIIVLNILYHTILYTYI